MNPILKHRKKIDHIDSQILNLLSARGKLAKEIGYFKKSKGGAVYVPDREKLIFNRLSRINRGPYKTESILSIFREIISATRSLEAPLRITYLGPMATFTHMAAVKYFGSSAELTPANGISMIFEEVEKGHTDYGVVPIENTTEGVVSHTLDMFTSSTLKVCAEIVLKVTHHLLSVESGLKAIKEVYSHPHALAQCRGWLLTHLPQAKLREVESTARAAQIAACKRGAAAIASEIASSVYGLPILKKTIQDQSKNYTRFLVIGEHDSKPTGDDKTSILFIAKDEVGALYKILEPFYRQKVNLNKIESRPLKSKAWEYVFFVDIDGHYEDRRVAKTLELVKKKCALFQVLGSYPKSPILN